MQTPVEKSYPKTTPKTITGVNAEELESQLQRHVDGEVHFDNGSKALYAADASNYRQVPIGVVIPKTVEAIIETVSLCRRYNAPLLSRGGGTSLSGQCCNTAVIMDMSKYLNQILEINPEHKFARVRPGVILDHLRHRTEKDYKLTYGPDPSTHNHCTFGGMIGNNSCGVHSVMAGRTADNVEELEILTYNGLRMKVGPTSEEELESIIQEGGPRGEIYRGLRGIRDRYSGLIRQRYPQIPRRVSGYNLDELLPENGFHVARALVGTEGTCVTILEAKVRLIYNPPVRSLLVLGYEDIYVSGDHIPQVMESSPVGLEGIDDKLLGYMKKKGLHVEDLTLLPEGKGWLLVEFGGENKDESDDKARQLMDILKKESNPPDMKLYDDEEKEKMIWEIRESGLGATAYVPGYPDAWPGWEDAAVDPNRLGNYLRDFRDLLTKHQYDCALYGHFGQGCIHCRINFDLKTQEGLNNYKAFLEEASDLVVQYNGSFSAEHGDGQSKAIFLPKIYGPELIEAFRQFKTLWDPEWKMNPGKVIEPDSPTTNLRLGSDYNPWSPATHFHFVDDHGSFAHASLRCVGVGKCRRTDGAFMCPSFQATLEEKDTTRGRAHMLFEMFRGEIIQDEWKSKAVLDSLDLCLACKGCKSECPVSVDMATYKAEFLSHHYGWIRPLSHYAMGWIGAGAKWAYLAPSVVNFFSHTPPFSIVLKATAGISSHRDLPSFASQTFMDWQADRKRDPPCLEDVEAVLFVDAFNNYFFPQALKAAVNVLEHYGIRLLIPETLPPSVRPLIHYGFLKEAKRQLKKVFEIFQPYVRKGLPVIGLEPSTVSVYCGEAADLLPFDEDGKRLSRHIRLFSEFILSRQVDFPSFPHRAILHGHCHQKAALNFRAAQQVLDKMDISYQMPEPGCCGMAGSFGFEANHYDLSMKIAERILLPTVRNASEDTLIIADGFSCRTQIEQGTPRKAMHLAEVMNLALEPDQKKERSIA